MPKKFLSYAEINLYNSEKEKTVVNSEFIYRDVSNNITLSSTVAASTKRNTVQKEESSQNTCKKPKKGPSSSSSSSMGTIMVRKQKLGDRIATLQQIVSPFGKSDTASVLQETLEYIQFLQDQIQYDVKRKNGLRNNDLRLRELCIVPVSFIKEVESEDNVAAYSYSPTTQNSLFSE